MNVFVYQWEKNGEKLKVTVDRESFSIARIEDDQISVICRPTEHEDPSGFAGRLGGG